MIILITTITIILYAIVIAFTIHNLNFGLNNIVKAGFIIIGLFVMFIITLIIFHISSSGINFENAEVYNETKKLLLAVFVPVNGLIVMPFVANSLYKLYDQTITQESFNKRIIILSIIFIAILIFECSYFKSTQQGIIEMLNKS